MSFITGVVFVALLIAGGAALALITRDIAFGDDPQPGVDVARFLPELGFAFMLLGGTIAAAAHIASTSFAGLASKALPRWLCIAGLVAAVLLLVSVLLVPIIVLPIWAILVSAVLLRLSSVGTRCAHRR